ncbi:MAG: Fic family protein, partial [Hyphomicrobium sp.]
ARLPQSRNPEGNDLPHRRQTRPQTTHLKQRGATIFLLNSPGEFRKEYVDLRAPNGTVVYVPPDWVEVEKCVDEFFVELKDIWVNGDALDVAAFALWRLNWIHPFKNGNGRTARSFAYACLCARLGVILPGTTTIIDQIMMTRDVYEACLRDADAAAERAGGRNLKPMRTYLDNLLQIQIASIGKI